MSITALFLAALAETLIWTMGRLREEMAKPGRLAIAYQLRGRK